MPGMVLPARGGFEGVAVAVESCDELRCQLAGSVRRTGLGPFRQPTLRVEQRVEFLAGVRLLQHRVLRVEAVRQFLQRGLLPRVRRLDIFSELLVHAGVQQSHFYLRVIDDGRSPGSVLAGQALDVGHFGDQGDVLASWLGKKKIWR